MSQTEHARLGGSGAHRWMKCAASPRLSEGMPDTDTEYTREGTAAHMLAERSLRNGMDPDFYVGEVLNGIEVTQEMAEAVNVFVQYVQRRVFELGATLYVERTFNLAPLNPPEPMFGTADAVLVTPELLEVVDYKHGVGVVVDVEENAQTMMYTLGAVIELQEPFPLLRSTIVQPRAPHDLGPIRSWQYPWATLVAFKNELMAAAWRVQDPNAPAVPGEHCRFCPAAGVCTARYEWAQEGAQQEFVQLVKREPADLSPELLRPEQIATILRADSQIRAWLSSVKEHAQWMLEHGEEVPGYKLVDGRAKRSWRSEKVATTFLRQHGLDPFTKKMRSPANAEDALRAVGAKLPDDMIVTTRGVSLAPEEDKRPGLQDAAAEFAGYLTPPATDDNE